MRDETGEPVRVLRRGVAMSALLGLCLSENTLALERGALHYKGVEYRFVLLNYQRVTRTIYLKDIESISDTLSVHPILLFLGALAGMNLIATVSSTLNFWWQLPFWNLPYGWLLADLLRAFGLTNAQWRIAHLTTGMIYVVLYALCRRTFFSFEAADPSRIVFRVDGIPEKTRRSFLKHCLESWESVKLGEDPQTQAGSDSVPTRDTLVLK